MSIFNKTVSAGNLFNGTIDQYSRRIPIGSQHFQRTLPTFFSFFIPEVFGENRHQIKSSDSSSVAVRPLMTHFVMRISTPGILIHSYFLLKNGVPIIRSICLIGHQTQYHFRFRQCFGKRLIGQHPLLFHRHAGSTDSAAEINLPDCILIQIQLLITVQQLSQTQGILLRPFLRMYQRFINSLIFLPLFSIFLKYPHRTCAHSFLPELPELSRKDLQ